MLGSMTVSDRRLIRCRPQRLPDGRPSWHPCLAATQHDAHGNRDPRIRIRPAVAFLMMSTANARTPARWSPSEDAPRRGWPKWAVICRDNYVPLRRPCSSTCPPSVPAFRSVPDLV